MNSTRIISEDITKCKGNMASQETKKQFCGTTKSEKKKKKK